MNEYVDKLFTNLAKVAPSGNRTFDYQMDQLFTNSSIHSDHLDRFPEGAKPYTTSVRDALAAIEYPTGLNIVRLPDGNWNVTLREFNDTGRELSPILCRTALYSKYGNKP